MPSNEITRTGLFRWRSFLLSISFGLVSLSFSASLSASPPPTVGDPALKGRGNVSAEPGGAVVERSRQRTGSYLGKLERFYVARGYIPSYFSPARAISLIERHPDRFSAATRKLWLKRALSTRRGRLLSAVELSGEKKQGGDDGGKGGDAGKAGSTQFSGAGRSRAGGGPAGAGRPGNSEMVVVGMKDGAPIYTEKKSLERLKQWFGEKQAARIIGNMVKAYKADSSGDGASYVYGPDGVVGKIDTSDGRVPFAARRRRVRSGDASGTGRFEARRFGGFSRGPTGTARRRPAERSRDGFPGGASRGNAGSGRMDTDSGPSFIQRDRLRLFRGLRDPSGGTGRGTFDFANQSIGYGGTRYGLRRRLRSSTVRDRRYGGSRYPYYSGGHYTPRW